MPLRGIGRTKILGDQVCEAPERPCCKVQRWGQFYPGPPDISDERAPKHVYMSLPYPSLANGNSVVYDDGTNSFVGSTNAHANSCIPQVIPIP
jgi:hypothetical protein